MQLKQKLSPLAYTISGPGQYIIVSVDITGLQSGASNIVSLEAQQPETPVEPVTPPTTPENGDDDTTDEIITPPSDEEEPSEEVDTSTARR